MKRDTEAHFISRESGVIVLDDSDEKYVIADVADNLYRAGGFEFSAEIKQVDEEKRIIEGAASTKMIDRVNELIMPSAFKSSLDNVKLGRIKVIVEHGFTRIGTTPVGKIIRARITKTEFIVRAVIFKGFTAADEAWLSILQGGWSAFSVGFKTTADEIRQIAGRAVRVVTDLDLYETSLTSMPANVPSEFSVVKGILHSESVQTRFNEFVEINAEAEIDEPDTKAVYHETLEYLREVNENMDSDLEKHNGREAARQIRSMNDELKGE